MNRKIREIMSARENGESGFTLIELLVVIIIIGILASIAIPIFMNQQKTARDSATTSDVKNVATNVQSALTRYPDAVYFAVSEDSVTVAPANMVAATAAVKDTDGNGKIKVWVGDNNDATTKKYEVYEVSVSKGTEIKVVGGSGANAGTFTVEGYNASGKSYVVGTPLKYDSAAGGINN